VPGFSCPFDRLLLTQSSRSLRNEKLIIRRIVESFRTRSFSVFAAELIVVVVGVFIGIQVSNWNDARLDRFRAHSYLERTRNDLDTDIINYGDRLKLWDQVSAYGALVLNHVNTGTEEELAEWDLLLAYFQASQMAEFITIRNTFDELKSGGELGLIRDLDLRNRLASYYLYADNTVLSERPAYREHVRGLIPLHVQSYIWTNCFSIQGESQVLKDCDAPIEQKDAADLIEVISKNTKLTSDLRYWMSSMQVALIMANDRISTAEQLRNLVSEIVERGP
jgi:hypothetical protein